MTRTNVGQRERINLYMAADWLAGLKKLAALKNTTYSELIRVACREYILREGPKAMVEAQTIKGTSE
jgi:hypothetical protein